MVNNNAKEDILTDNTAYYQVNTAMFKQTFLIKYYIQTKI